MLAMMPVLALLALADPPPPERPPSPKALAAIADRGRMLAGYDAAASHASDAVQAKQPADGSVVRYIAHKTDRGRVVAFGKLDEKGDSFLIAFEARQGKDPNAFDVKAFDPPRKDKGFVRSAARAIDVALQDFVKTFKGERRPYNVAVLPAEEGDVFVYLFPAQTNPRAWPLGGDVRYRVTAGGTKVADKRTLHTTVIEREAPEAGDQNRVAAGFHTHVLDETPEDTDVFHVLSRKPAAPELIATKTFVFQVAPDGRISYLGKAEDMFKNK